jgi:hypothetical protein
MKKIRQLDILDLSKIKSILSLDVDLIKSFENYFLSDERFKSFGLFLNDELIEIISVIENQEIPAYTLSRCHSYFKLDDNCLLKFVIDYYEKEKLIYQFFTLLDDHDLTKITKLIDRYNYYLEHRLLPGELSNYENIDHDVLSYRFYDRELTIHMWVLKNECRIN